MRALPRRAPRRSRPPARSAGAGGDTSGHGGGYCARAVRSRLRARAGAGPRRRDRAPPRGRVAPGRSQVDHPAQGRLPAGPRRSAMGPSRCRARRARGRGAHPRPKLRLRRRAARSGRAVHDASAVRRGGRAPRHRRRTGADDAAHACRARGAGHRAGRALLHSVPVPVPRTLHAGPGRSRARYRRAAEARGIEAGAARSRGCRGDSGYSGGFPADAAAAHSLAGGPGRPGCGARRRRQGACGDRAAGASPRLRDLRPCHPALRRHESLRPDSLPLLGAHRARRWSRPSTRTTCTRGTTIRVRPSPIG